jgi:hypothetical protein
VRIAVSYLQSCPNILGLVKENFHMMCFEGHFGLLLLVPRGRIVRVETA